MIKGPKAILSSAISGALAEYFVVDEKGVESNLLRDAKIVLRRVDLRERVSRVPINGAGKSTAITITGCVDEVAFTWAWSAGGAMWVDDAVLTIVGADFQLRLEHAETDKEDDADVDKRKERRESFVDPSTIDETSAGEIKKQKGGLAGFVERQVKMVIDALTMKMAGFKLHVVLPHTPLLPGHDISSTDVCDKVLALCADKIEILSLGRSPRDGSEADSPSKLKQRINLNSFECGIHLEGKEDKKQIISYPLVEPFSYSAEVTRVGERFGGFSTDMEVLGLGQPTDFPLTLPSLTGSGLFVHVGPIQVDSLTQLSVLMLAPTNGSNTDDCPKREAKEDPMLSQTEMDASISSTSDPSSFYFPLSSISLVLFEETRFALSRINMRYKADGTVCSVEVGKMEYESAATGEATASQILIMMRPAVKITIGCIDSLHILDMLLLTNPIQSSEISYEGDTLTVRMDKVDVVAFSKTESTPASATVSAPKLPCNINLCIQEGIQVRKSEDGSLSKFGRFNLYALKEESWIKVAIQFESYKTSLLSLTTTSFCGTLPLNQVDTVNDFFFTSADVIVKSGYSTGEWEEVLQPRKQKVKQNAKATSHGKGLIKLPFATIGDLKITISYEASHKIGRIKDTTLMIKAYTGKSETTSKDLVHYYARACLSRAPEFISNAEVLGLNIVDSTTGMLSTWAGLGLGSAFGAGAGVAAIATVDAIKGAVDAGKRSRNVGEEEKWKPGDFMRGLVQTAGKATQDGASMRGKQGDGNIIDWAVGATSNTTEYVVDNKNRLGAAGAGGGGFLLGMALGGPVGAVIGGLVGTATAGVTLDRLDEMVWHSENGKDQQGEKE